MKRIGEMIFWLALIFVAPGWVHGQVDEPSPVKVDPRGNPLDGLKIVYFGAKWCLPCHTQHANLEILSGHDNLPIRFIDVDKDKSLMQHLKVDRVPTTLVLYDGAVKKKWVGIVDREVMLEEFRKWREKFPPKPIPDSYPDAVIDIAEDDSGLELLSPKGGSTDGADTSRDQRKDVPAPTFGL
jgi:thiol-disulfide isomerase/thioredoxin